MVKFLAVAGLLLGALPLIAAQASMATTTVTVKNVTLPDFKSETKFLAIQTMLSIKYSASVFPLVSTQQNLNDDQAKISFTFLDPQSKVNMSTCSSTFGEAKNAPQPCGRSGIAGAVDGATRFQVKANLPQSLSFRLFHTVDERGSWNKFCELEKKPDSKRSPVLKTRQTEWLEVKISDLQNTQKDSLWFSGCVFNGTGSTSSAVTVPSGGACELNWKLGTVGFPDKKGDTTATQMITAAWTEVDAPAGSRGDPAFTGVRAALACPR